MASVQKAMADPTEDFEGLIELAKEASEAENPRVSLTQALAGGLLVLDDWIRAGGILPERWQKRGKRSSNPVPPEDY